MACCAKVITRNREDPLAYLPRQSVAEFRRGHVIYNYQHPSAGLYMVVSGTVKIAMVSDTGKEMVVDVYGGEQFFGDYALLGSRESRESATAYETATVMVWSPAAVEQQIERQPKLGLALIQMFVQRCLDYEARLQSMAYDKVSRRLALGLVHLAQRLGAKDDDGAMRIPAFTHQLLSDYVGTSREIVTTHMNYLRGTGYLRYSRKHIDIDGSLLEHVADTRHKRESVRE